MSAPSTPAHLHHAERVANRVTTACACSAGRTVGTSKAVPEQMRACVRACLRLKLPPRLSRSFLQGFPGVSSRASSTRWTVVRFLFRLSAVQHNCDACRSKRGAV
eukprot:364053-Chlamydomonas_euryale.AAC.14